MKWGLLVRNPADAATPPRPQGRELQTWDSETIHTFLQASKASPYLDLYNLAVLTGMRRAELCGLAWRVVDLERGKLSVVKTLQRISGHGLWEGQPKTGKSRRSIALSVSAVKLLKNARNKQIEQRLAAGPAWTDSGYVFAHADGRPIDSDRVSKDFARIVRVAGLPHMTLHGLRHAHATLLLTAGVHPQGRKRAPGPLEYRHHNGHLLPRPARSPRKRLPWSWTNNLPSDMMVTEWSRTVRNQVDKTTRCAVGASSESGEHGGISWSM